MLLFSLFCHSFYCTLILTDEESFAKIYFIIYSLSFLTSPVKYEIYTPKIWFMMYEADL